MPDKIDGIEANLKALGGGIGLRDEELTARLHSALRNHWAVDKCTSPKDISDLVWQKLEPLIADAIQQIKTRAEQKTRARFAARAFYNMADEIPEKHRSDPVTRLAWISSSAAPQEIRTPTRTLNNWINGKILPKVTELLLEELNKYPPPPVPRPRSKYKILAVTGLAIMAVIAFAIAFLMQDIPTDSSATRTSDADPSSSSVRTNTDLPFYVTSDYGPGCGGRDWISPSERAISNPPTAEDDAYALAKGAGVTPDRLDFTLEGKSDAAVTIKRIQVHVIEKNPPLAGSRLIHPCGGEGATRWLEVDLDADPPRYRAEINEAQATRESIPERRTPIAFPYTVSSTDPESFTIMGVAEICDCSWTVEIFWTSQGKSGSFILDNNGKPFRTTSVNTAGATQTGDAPSQQASSPCPPDAGTCLGTRRGDVDGDGQTDEVGLTQRGGSRQVEVHAVLANGKAAAGISDEILFDSPGIGGWLGLSDLTGDGTDEVFIKGGGGTTPVLDILEYRSGKFQALRGDVQLSLGGGTAMSAAGFTCQTEGGRTQVVAWHGEADVPGGDFIGPETIYETDGAGVLKEVDGRSVTYGNDQLDEVTGAHCTGLDRF